MDKNKIGKTGELAAVKYLKKRNYRILSQNFTAGGGELDIVALYKKMLIFVEVKTRSNDLYGEPISAVGINKMKTVIRTADYFENDYVKNSKLNTSLSVLFFSIKIRFRIKGRRYDIIEVFMDRNKKITKIVHHKNFFDENTVLRLENKKRRKNTKYF